MKWWRSWTSQGAEFWRKCIEEEEPRLVWNCAVRTQAADCGCPRWACRGKWHSSVRVRGCCVLGSRKVMVQTVNVLCTCMNFCAYIGRFFCEIEWLCFAVPCRFGSCDCCIVCAEARRVRGAPLTNVDSCASPESGCQSTAWSTLFSSMYLR
jgi:hypothetical protein